MLEPKAEFNAVGAPVTRGTCPVCGTGMYRLGRSEAHEGMVAPAKSPKAPREKQPAARKGKLVIVESPAKAKTIGRYLGHGYTVRASVGHVRDLLRSSLSVDVEHDFQPKYRVPNEKQQIVKDLKELAKQSEEVYLATDPDREGEAIAWHLMEAVEIDPSVTHRVVFHEITQTAIREAFANSRSINMALVDAQQARRILDRLVGYSLSPLLWEKVRSRLSAGRVQSVALRLIAERERKIEEFVPTEYWTIEADLLPEGSDGNFRARLARIDDEEAQLPNQEVVNGMLADMEKADYAISKIKRSERRRKSAAPFITSTLQQEASRRLEFTARRTMALAQQLYEGLDIGEEEGGNTGLITYMRTDSTNVAQVAQQEAREYIEQVYSKPFMPETAPLYKTRVKGAQEAHEAIRPTSVKRSPDKIKSYLNRDQFKLYQLIWQRFVASQMEAAIFDTVSVEITSSGTQKAYLLRASGSILRFAGFLTLYEETRDEDLAAEEGENVRIPATLEEGQRQKLERLLPEQHFTQPPPRFTEATLVKTLEEFGIGRPSTYAPILSTIQERGYVVRENKRLMPTETGILVNDLLVSHFPEIVDTNFTAHMEEDLDDVAEGDRPWVEVVRNFYSSFGPQMERAREEMPETKMEPEQVGRACPQCGHDLIIRWGRFGKFISCSNFPTCRYTEALLEKIGVNCPECGGELVARKTRKGRIFYGCSNYPTCPFTSWKRPIPTPCPKCGGLLVIANKREVQCLKCSESFLQEEVNEGEATSEEA